VYGLCKAAVTAARERGFEMIYSLPERAWLPVFRLFPRFGLPRFDAAAFGCAALPLDPATASRLEPSAWSVEARPVAQFGAEHEELWQSARESFPISCGVVRDGGWLTFRNSGRIAFEIRRLEDGSLVGYSAIKRQTGLLADLLVRRPEHLQTVLAATALRLAHQPHGPGALTHLKAMLTPALEPALRALGFEPVDYTFAFTCTTLGDGLEGAAPERWYIMPGD
jgi:hypothetical protein